MADESKNARRVIGTILLCLCFVLLIPVLALLLAAFADMALTLFGLQDFLLMPVTLGLYFLVLLAVVWCVRLLGNDQSEKRRLLRERRLPIYALAFIAVYAVLFALTAKSLVERHTDAGIFYSLELLLVWVWSLLLIAVLSLRKDTIPGLYWIVSTSCAVLGAICMCISFLTPCCTGG